MSEIVERVARAIAHNAWQVRGKIGVDSLAMENRRKASLRHARAAIEAMRHPTTEMGFAGFDQLDNEASPHAAEACWTAMIDAALTQDR